MLSTKSKSQRDELVHRVERVDAALAATTGLMANQTEAQHAAAELHRNVSQIVTTADREAGELWTQTLAKSRVLHEKVAGQLKTKAERRRAEREVVMRWEAVARRTPSERRQEERRRVGCCGCGRKPPLLSKAAIAAATAAYDAGDWPGAMKAYDHALMMMTTTEVESRAKAHLVRCECFQQMHDFQSMEMEAEALLRTAGDTWSGFRMRGTARYQQGRREEALADFELALVHKVRVLAVCVSSSRFQLRRTVLLQDPTGKLAGFAGLMGRDVEEATRADCAQLRQEGWDAAGADAATTGGCELSEAREAQPATTAQTDPR